MTEMNEERLRETVAWGCLRTRAARCTCAGCAAAFAIKHIDALRAERDELLKWKRTHSVTANIRIRAETAEARVAELEDRLRDHEECARATLREECAGDERHCACVPVLRAEVARLTAEMCGQADRLLERTEEVVRLRAAMLEIQDMAMEGRIGFGVRIACAVGDALTPTPPAVRNGFAHCAASTDDGEPERRNAPIPDAGDGEHERLRGAPHDLSGNPRTESVSPSMADGNPPPTIELREVCATCGGSGDVCRDYEDDHAAFRCENEDHVREPCPGCKGGDDA